MASVSQMERVTAAARERADALARHDRQGLLGVLHPNFVWTSHRGEVFDVESYVAANSGPDSWWLSQTLDDVRVTVAGSTAVLVATVTDEIRTPDGREAFRMPVTQTWVREDGRWLCLAGHAGPRLSPP
jgi:ketosteroid isomerase-like protein